MGFGSFHQQYFLDGKSLLQIMSSQSWKINLYTAHVSLVLLTLQQQATRDYQTYTKHRPFCCAFENCYAKVSQYCAKYLGGTPIKYG